MIYKFKIIIFITFETYILSFDEKLNKCENNDARFSFLKCRMMKHQVFLIIFIYAINLLQ